MINEMDTDNESEPEIQIEYYELHETDQLSLTNIQKNERLLLNRDYRNILDVQVNEKNDSNLVNPVHEPSHDVNNTETRWHRSVDSNKQLLCKFCELKYSTVETLRIHIKRKHSNEYLKLKKSVVNCKRNKHVCRICRKDFYNITDLKIHVNNSHNINIIKLSCTDCDATFDSSKELSIHMFEKHKKNFNLLIFVCDICGHRTMKQSHFKQHSNTHLKKKLSCQYCDYKTNSTSNLKTHEYIHTKNKPFKCDFKDCDYRCGSKSALRGHKLKHYPEKNMLFCDKCNYKTVYRHSLKKHSSHERNCTRVQ